MTIAQIFDFKELTGKIFKLNDLLPRRACKLFIPRSQGALPGCKCGRFRPRYGLYKTEIRVSCIRVKTAP